MAALKDYTTICCAAPSEARGGGLGGQAEAPKLCFGAPRFALCLPHAPPPTSATALMRAPPPKIHAPTPCASPRQVLALIAVRATAALTARSRRIIAASAPLPPTPAGLLPTGAGTHRGARHAGAHRALAAHHRF